MVQQANNCTIENYNTLKELFEVNACKHENQTAIEYGDQQHTYGEIEERANKLAKYLIKQGVRLETRVCLFLEPSPDMIVAILAILKAGGAYVPVDITTPKDRLEFILEDTQAKVLITDEVHFSAVQPLKRENLFLININHGQHFEGDASILSTIGSDSSLAYIIYTSGSTGHPKGVMIENGQCLNTISDMVYRFKICEQDKLLLVSSIGFDLSVFDIFGAFFAGATLVIPKFHINKGSLVYEWQKALLEKGVTIWNSAPLLMKELVQHVDKIDISAVSSLRLVLLSGDWIPLDLPDRVRSLFSQNLQLISLGGATEGSIWSIFYPIQKICKTWKSIPYGRALHNQSIWVLDKNFKQCSAGEIGEIHIGGKGVARGYLNRDKLTKEKFVEPPCLPHLKGEKRLYKTGDLGRYMADGNVEILGRIDGQIKVKGVRIEMGEILYHLDRCQEINHSAVLTEKDDDGDVYLACLYEKAKSNQSTKGCEKDIRSHLQQYLPLQMIPSLFVPVDKIPLNASGKADQKALKAILQQHKRENYIDAHGEYEPVVSRFWMEILSIDKISTEDDFFALGGHSLKAARLCQKLSKEFGIEVPEAVFLENATIKKISKFIKEQLAS